MAKYVGYKRPKNTKKSHENLLRYLGYHKWLLLLVAVLVAISSGVSIAGTYLIRPVINDYAIPGDIPGLIRMMLAMGILYLCGVCATFAYNRLMVHTSQQVVTEIGEICLPIFRSCRCPILMRAHHGGADEPFYKRCRYGTGSIKRHVFHADPELFDTDRNPQHAVCFERASDTDRITVFSSERIFYLVQWKTR